MIQEIQLITTLPRVFAGMENDEPVCSSQVWLNEVTLQRPDHYMIEAESGTGKSSLCSYIYGSRGDYSGRILFDGEDISTFSIDRWCRLRTRALENIQIKNRLTGCKTDRWITEALERLEIGGKANQTAGTLSVGQQQRVAIIRALCQPFDFILIDEPVSHLDARNNSIVAALIAEEASRYGASVIATSVGNKINLPITHTLKL